MDIQNAALLVRLRGYDNGSLATRVMDYRERVQTWLLATHNLFVHYPSHGVDHCDEIILQLSQLLFDDPQDAESMRFELNPMEIFLLAVSVYTHDTGMVVRQSEMSTLVTTPEWRDFLADNVELASDYEASRAILADPAARDEATVYHAGLMQRWLLAEYFRRRHADRVELSVNSALNLRELVLWNDPSLLRVVVAICRGHGLSRDALLDYREYPLRRDFKGMPVNVRLLTILLRMGDLLDMRFERACDLLKTSATPMPAASIPHWDQYEGIYERVTSPSEIRIGATFDDPAVHRIVRDWCTWLVEEVEDTPRLLAGDASGREWRPPRATMHAKHPTINLEKASNASYRVVDWKFRLDADAITRRIVEDVHGDTFGYLQELIQNAADASRVRMITENQETEFDDTNLYPSEVRSRYALAIDLECSESEVNAVVVRDHGVGMDDDTVTNYLLQVGRSWYRSREFLSRYKFQPSSQYGIGFMSVFSVSTAVTVMSRRFDAPPAEGIKLSLSGPKDYLLVEDEPGCAPGTEVRVVLTDSANRNDLEAYLERLIRAVEFPVHVSVNGEVVRTLPSPPRLFPELPSFGAGRVKSLSIQIERNRRYGKVEFAVLETPEGETLWESPERYIDELRETAFVEVPNLRESWFSVNGLASIGPPVPSSNFIAAQIDLRGEHDLGLARSRFKGKYGRFELPEVTEAVVEHLRSSEATSFGYAMKVIDRFESYCDMQAINDIPNVVPIWSGESRRYVSISSAREALRLAWLADDDSLFSLYLPQDDLKRAQERGRDWRKRAGSSVSAPDAIWASDLVGFPRVATDLLFDNCKVVRLEAVDNSLVVAHFSQDRVGQEPRRVAAVPFDAVNKSVLATKFPRFDKLLLNRDHPFCEMLVRLQDLERSIYVEFTSTLSDLLKYQRFASTTEALKTKNRFDRLCQHAAELTGDESWSAYGGNLTVQRTMLVLHDPAAVAATVTALMGVIPDSVGNPRGEAGYRHIALQALQAAYVLKPQVAAGAGASEVSCAAD
jgi:hypothetical protein